MRPLVLAAAILGLAITPALADSKPSQEEMEKIKETLSKWGCQGGEAVKEAGTRYPYEIDDVTCQDGQRYDVELGEDFKLLSLRRD